MDADTIIAIIIGAVNFLALVFVGWQTYLTRKSEQLNQKNLKESQQANLITNLPRAYSIIYMQTCLQGWEKDLKLLVNSEGNLKRKIEDDNTQVIIHFQYWFGLPQGLIDKSSYDHLPDWLQEIITTGARYYYQSMCLLDSVRSPDGTEDFRQKILKGMVERAKLGITHLNEMLIFIDEMIPKWYLESPASLKDSDFWEKK